MKYLLLATQSEELAGAMHCQSKLKNNECEYGRDSLWRDTIPPLLRGTLVWFPTVTYQALNFPEPRHEASGSLALGSVINQCQEKS